MSIYKYYRCVGDIDMDRVQKRALNYELADYLVKVEDQLEKEHVEEDRIREDKTREEKRR